MIYIYFLGMNKLSIFYKLEYRKDLLVTHLLDHMHIVKNVASSLYRYTTSKELNTIQLRSDLKATKTKCAFWVTKNSDGTTNVPSPTSWIMTKDEVNILHNVVKNIKIPMGYASSLRKAFIVDEKMTGLKSHDYHKLLKVLSYFMYIEIFIYIYIYICMYKQIF